MAALVVTVVMVGPFAMANGPRAISAVKQEVAVLEADMKDSARNTQPTPAPTVPPGQQPSPAPTPSPSGQTAWLQPSADSCSWAEGILTEDHTLDLQAATQYTAWTTYYRTTAQWWVQAGQVVRDLCGGGAPPTVATCQAVLGHFDTAESTHISAANGNSPASEPGTLASDRSWNLTWVANYKRLFDIVDQTGCGGSGA